MTEICGVTGEFPQIFTGRPLVYRCEREPDHNGTVHEGRCTNGDGTCAQWPIHEPAATP